MVMTSTSASVDENGATFIVKNLLSKDAIIIITRLMTHVKVIHGVKNRKSGFVADGELYLT